jgi:DUF971 family protein
MHAGDDFTRDQTTPSDLKLNRDEQRLTVTWKDGHVSVFDAVVLRKKCPCATCNAERQKQSESTALFTILKSDPGIGPPKAVGARLVGNYAIQLHWTDNHDTGIYDFRFLRALDAGRE